MSGPSIEQGIREQLPALHQLRSWGGLLARCAAGELRLRLGRSLPAPGPALLLDSEMAVRDVRVSVSLSGNGGVGHPSTTHLRGGSAGRSRAYTPTQHPWTLVQSMRPRNRPVTDDFRASYRLSKLARTYGSPRRRSRSGRVAGPECWRCCSGSCAAAPLAGCPGPPPPILTPGCVVVGRNRVTAAVSVTSWWGGCCAGGRAGDQRGVRVLRAGGLGTERTGPTAGTTETPVRLRETPVHSGNASVCGR